MSNGNDSLSDSDLHALVDGELSLEREARVRERLKTDPGAAASLEAYQAINERLRKAYDPLLSAPVPPRLLIAGAAKRRAVGRVGLALAAGVVLGLAMGLWLAQPRVPEDASIIESALSAHRVYIPEVRHAVEVAATERAHLDKWLTKRLHHELAAPDLQAEGLMLVGGRLLPDRGRPAAQYMYETANGQRVTIYCQLEDSGRETALRFASGGEDRLFHWVEGGMAYAIVADLPKAQLRTMAESAHRQL